MSPRHPYLDGGYPRAYAHRGWHLDELAGCENTLAAFRRAVAEGFGYLELDVHASARRGGRSCTTTRCWTAPPTAPGRSPPAPAAELATVRVRGREPLPRLEQVLTELPDTRITIELKSGAAVSPVLDLLDRTDSWHRVCLGSYHDGWLDRARRLAGPRLCTSLGQASAFGLRSRAWLDSLPWPGPRLPGPPVTGQLAQLPRRFGRADRGRRGPAAGRPRVRPRGARVDGERPGRDGRAARPRASDGILSDRPDLLRELLDRRGSWTGP